MKRQRKKRIKKSGPLREVWEGLMTFFRLIKAYAKKEYCEIPLESIVLILASIIYLIMPINLISDILPRGYIDDASLIARTMTALAVDIEIFKRWEENKQNEPK